MLDPINEACTIDEYTDEYNELEISFDTLHLKQNITLDSDEEITLLLESILTKYKTDLEGIVELKTLDNAEQEKYRYNPFALSYDLYGTVEYWFLLLDLNDIPSIADFNRSQLKVYDASITDLIGEIFVLEESAINLNQQQISSSNPINDNDDDE